MRRSPKRKNPVDKFCMKNKRAKNIKNFICFAGPALFFFFAIIGAAFISGVQLSFTDWNGLADSYHFVGLTNYINAFKDAEFITSLLKTFEYVVIQHFIYSQNHSIHVKFNKAPASNKVTYIPSDSLIPEPFMLPLSRTNEKRQATTVQSRPVFPQTAPGVKLPCALTSI